MTLFRRVTEICRERLPSIRIARITIDSIFDLDSMLQPGIRFGVTVKNTGELVGTPIVSMGNFFFEVDVMDGAEEWIIQKMSNWQNGIYRSFYRIFYKEVCQTRLDGEDGVELGWRNSYDVFQLKSQIRIEWEKKVGVYNLTKNVLPSDDFYTLSWCSEERQYAPAYVPADVRKEGLIITFKSYSEWETWQFTGPLENFSAAGNWKRIDPFIATSIYTDVYDADAQIPLGVREYYQISNNDDQYYLPSLIPVESRVPFMKVKFINSSGRSVIMRYLHAALDYFNNYDHWQVLQLGDIDNVSLQKMLTGQSDFLNLTEKVPPTAGYYMLFSGSPGQIAVNHVPEDYRNPGVVITFFSGVVWELWQFIGTDASEQWFNPSYWLERSNYTLTKAAIEEKLTGDIETHTHEHLNQLCELVAVRTTDPDVTFIVYEQGAKYYNPHTNLIHTLDYSDEVNPWYYAEQPKVGVLYYSLSDESSSYAKLWRYTGTEMLEIPVHPSLAFDTALRETAVNVASVGDIYEVSLTPQTNNIQYIVIPSDYALSTVFIELIMDSIISGMFIMDLYVYVESSATPILNLTNTSEVLGRYLYFKPGYSVPATLAKGLHHFRFIRDMSELVNVNLHVEHTYSTLALLEAHGGVYNLTENVPPEDDFYTLSVMSTEEQYAPAHVPVGVRKNGLIITFRSNSEWEIWQFIGTDITTQWNNVNYWLERSNCTALAGYAALAGSTSQDFSTKNLNVAGYVQVGSARLVYVPETEDLPAYLKLQHSDGTTPMHFIMSGGGTMYSTGVPAIDGDGGAIIQLNSASQVAYNDSEDKVDILVGAYSKKAFYSIVPDTASGWIYVNIIFNNLLPYSDLAEYELFLYVESANLTATVLNTSTSGINVSYTSGLEMGALTPNDLIGKGLHKLTFTRDMTTASTHMLLYVRHEYFEKV